MLPPSLNRLGRRASALTLPVMDVFVAQTEIEQSSALSREVKLACERRIFIFLSIQLLTAICVFFVLTFEVVCCLV